jgi:hypothetical protein
MPASRSLWSSERPALAQESHQESALLPAAFPGGAQWLQGPHGRLPSPPIPSALCQPIPGRQLRGDTSVGDAGHLYLLWRETQVDYMRQSPSVARKADWSAKVPAGRRAPPGGRFYSVLEDRPDGCTGSTRNIS